jgi:hypothetical protein
LTKTTNLKDTYYNGSSVNIENLINYFHSIGGNTLTTSCRRQNAFKTKWTKKEETLRNRCHIQNAIEYLESIKNNLSQKQIQTVIADITVYVKNIDPNEDVSFIVLSTNTLPSAIHFDIAKRLFLTHQIRDQHQDNYGSDLLTVYTLRLSLESRIKGLLGIDYADTKGKPIGLNSLIEIAKELKSIKYSDKFSWQEIDWVNKWINHHIHRSLRPHPWIIFQALLSLEPLLSPKEAIETKDNRIYSWYSATFVEDELTLHEEIDSALKTKDPEIKIAWLAKREVTTNK